MLSYEYIRGLTEGEGTFTFSTNLKLNRKVPAFSIKMASRDKELLEMIRDALGIKNRVYIYNHKKKDGSKRLPQAMLIIKRNGISKKCNSPSFLQKIERR